MSKLKVLFTIPNFKTAGSQYVLLSLFRKIDKDVFDPYICVESSPEAIPNDISKKRSLVFKWTGNKLKDVLKYRNLLRTNKIDIVHSWDYKSNYLEALSCRVSGVKYIYTKKNNSWSKRWKLKSLLSNHIAYDNPEMKNRFFNSFLFRNKTTFIPHGVDTEVFSPLKKDTHETFNIGCIGNIGENKNQLFILKALSMLPEQITLHLYGNENESYRTLLNNFIEANGLKDRVYFHGFVENKNIPQVLNKLDLFVLPSINEGMPVSLLEAMACGVPVLSSDSGGGAKYILESGGGYIFNGSDFNTLIKNIARLFNDPKEMEMLSKAALKNVANNFSLQKEIANYEELYSNFKK